MSFVGYKNKSAINRHLTKQKLSLKDINNQKVCDDVTMQVKYTLNKYRYFLIKFLKYIFLRLDFQWNIP